MHGESDEGMLTRAMVGAMARQKRSNGRSISGVDLDQVMAGEEIVLRLREGYS